MLTEDHLPIVGIDITYKGYPLTTFAPLHVAAMLYYPKWSKAQLPDPSAASKILAFRVDEHVYLDNGRSKWAMDELPIDNTSTKADAVPFTNVRHNIRIAWKRNSLNPAEASACSAFGA